ncbi:general secretion pathway protein J [Variovorax sp. HW608]|uniref:PulJ/GspJ family protein n=1 Tax=Variovorax sp. HW608 TaxID=1034889 RepID=UPI00081FEAB5|nr:prepilin-type N-terminal cleavage/methylation domain-containing protein [Variovorax sp. HW608]SCK44133.1 general secretion pathway protein J [Variovorax sp. HW608]
MRRSNGFTLIELLVAIAVMALLAIMSWRGLDGMARAQAQNRERGDAVLTLQTTLTQWGADLDATVALSRIRAIDWDGRVLRLTRRSTDGDTPRIHVVAWTLRTDPATGTRWLRWQSPGFTTQAEWQQAWDRAAAWAQGSSGNAGDAEVDLLPVAQWQVYYFRNDAWSPAVSAETLGTSTPLPDGVRLVLGIPAGASLSGTITRDWVRPSLTVPKS